MKKVSILLNVEALHTIICVGDGEGALSLAWDRG